METSGEGTTTYCISCGHAGLQGDHYCTECGAPLLPPVQRRPLFADEVPNPPLAPEPASPTPAPGLLRRRGGWLVAALALLVAAGAVGFSLGHGDDGTPLAVRRPTTSTATSPSPAPASPSPSLSPSPSPSHHPPTRSASTPPPVLPQDRLQRLARRDDQRVRRLVGSWVPQLAAVTPGAGGDRSWSDALAHVRQLRTDFPSLLVLDTGQWPHSYEYGGMYAVVIPKPGRTPRPALSWCRAHVGNPADCAAKLIATTGSWADNFDSGLPGPG